MTSPDLYLNQRDILSAIIYAKEKSNLHELHRRLTETVVMRGCTEVTDPETYAAFGLSGYITAHTAETLAETADIEGGVNLALKTLAFKYWENRTRFKLPGSEKGDWNVALDTLVDACFSTLGEHASKTDEPPLRIAA